MSRKSGPYNDLTIYDKGLDAKTEKSFDRIKLLFDIFMGIFCTNVALSIFF